MCKHICYDKMDKGWHPLLMCNLCLDGKSKVNYMLLTKTKKNTPNKMSQKIKGIVKGHIRQKHTRWGRKGVVRVIIPHKVEIKAESTKQTKKELIFYSYKV